MIDHADIYARTTRNRFVIADVLEGLEPVQWNAATLCDGWTVRHLAGHLLQPVLVGFGRFFRTALRHRGDTDATVDHLARSLAHREPDELVTLLRRHAADRIDPPRVGPMGPFADTCLHLRDIARPLGLVIDVRHDDWLLLLPYLTSGRATPGLVPAARLEGLSLRATDAGWAHGDGPELRGTLEALAMAATGRAAAVADLDGPGVAVLASRLGAHPPGGGRAG